MRKYCLEIEETGMTMNVMEIIRKTMGWCPDAAILNKKEEIYMVSYGGKSITNIRNMGFEGFLGILHLVLGAWLIITALRILAEPQILPWWIMNINIISSGILLVIGISSLLIFFNFLRSANIHRMLALANIVLLIGFFLYLSQFLIQYDPDYSIFNKPYENYLFGLVTLAIFTLIISVPSVLTFFSKPKGERKARFLTAAILILFVVFALIGFYYMYLNKQKDSMLTEETGNNGEVKLYKIEHHPSYWSWSTDPYFIDSSASTTGHLVSKDTYDAIKFLKNEGNGRVMAWWDYELEIKMAGKEPVISYASESIRTTIARPASLYDRFERDEKVADVSRFFATDSEDVAKGIAEKYGANLVYISRQRIFDLIGVMIAAGGSGFNPQDIKTPEDYLEKIIKPTMAYKFNTGADLKNFDKVFENKDVIIYKLK